MAHRCTRARSLLLAAAAISLVPATTAGQATPSPAPRSERTALRYSLWGTVVPIGAGIALGVSDVGHAEGLFVPTLMALGITLGPSLGHFYAGNSRRGWRGAAVRTGVLVGSVAAFAAACDLCLDQDDPDALVVAGAGTVLLAVLAIRDIVAAPGSVREHPDRMGIGPWLPAGGGLGMAGSWRF